MVVKIILPALWIILRHYLRWQFNTRGGAKNIVTGKLAFGLGLSLMVVAASASVRRTYGRRLKKVDCDKVMSEVRRERRPKTSPRI